MLECCYGEKSPAPVHDEVKAKPSADLILCLTKPLNGSFLTDVTEDTSFNRSFSFVRSCVEGLEGQIVFQSRICWSEAELIEKPAVNGHAFIRRFIRRRYQCSVSGVRSVYSTVLQLPVLHRTSLKKPSVLPVVGKRL